VLTYLLIKYQHKSRWLTVGLAFLLAGRLGNGWDRLLRGYVVDMVYFNIFNLPLLNFVCNLADILITIGVIMLIVYVFKSDNQRGEE
ncbi:signal peptidase II, partial [Bombilactobacillus bombi]|uniref:signal peptidase II n=1 Tax=Bombilactobacillus bombi TaxID=1303590 RepID=UPI0015E60353